jgi:glyoxylase-like metal-dependent hydrolase (beta-lactamase superfamily II)
MARGTIFVVTLLVQMKKKHFRETKNLDSIRETAEHKNYKSDVATVLFTIYHFDVAGSGSVNVDRPIRICHVSACHVSTNSRPARNFFFKFRILVGRPIKAR